MCESDVCLKLVDLKKRRTNLSIETNFHGKMLENVIGVPVGYFDILNCSHIWLFKLTFDFLGESK